MTVLCGQRVCQRVTVHLPPQGTPPQPLQPPAPGTQPVPPVPVAAPGTPGGFPQGIATGKVPVATAQPTQAAPTPAPPKLPPAASKLAICVIIKPADVLLHCSHRPGPPLQTKQSSELELALQVSSSTHVIFMLIQAPLLQLQRLLPLALPPLQSPPAHQLVRAALETRLCFLCLANFQQ